MKKVFVTVAIALGFISTSIAQEIDFGVQVGANFAKLSGEDIEDADGRTGFNVGITGEVQTSQQFGILVGAIYSQQGLDGEVFGEEATLKLDYINVPVLAKFYLGGSGLALEAGPQIGFLVNDEIEVNGTDFDQSIFEAQNIDFSAGGGMSYKFKEGTTLEGLAFGARYMIGLNNVYEDNETFDDDVTNSVLSINLGYKF
ncbi:porin family protein [Nonlabens ponticola]|uniref:PorT family protein n=1 Tax=Nonlabens ponticola TaxID=2496866 RepID=A0A3S9MXB8_9FLAO|nr:porin family protein [Nonlabens ponticola]AZQ43782.1 PorT family protein [Nonlabens ponticola]